MDQQGDFNGSGSQQGEASSYTPQVVTTQAAPQPSSGLSSTQPLSSYGEGAGQYADDYQQGYNAAYGSPQSNAGQFQQQSQQSVQSSRPDWFPESHWDMSTNQPNVQGLADSYNQLQQHMNNSGPADDSVLQMALNVAHESGMGVNQTHRAINSFMGKLSKVAPLINLEQELNSLGPNGRQVRMEEGVYNIALNLGQTADGIRLLNMLRTARAESSLPSQGASKNSGMSLQDWYNKSYERDRMGNETEEQFDERMKNNLMNIMRNSGMDDEDINLGNYSVQTMNDI